MSAIRGIKDPRKPCLVDPEDMDIRVHYHVDSKDMGPEDPFGFRGPGPRGRLAEGSQELVRSKGHA